MHVPRLIVLFWLALGFVVLCEGQTITPKHSRKFARYDNCAFVPTSYVDGDSFRVRIREQEFVFRLYFVDCPEADERFPDRNEEQARYFGITAKESVAVGKAARKYVSELLAGRPFTVFTRWSDALGQSKLPRYYAVIEVDGKRLSDSLVENGFARLHGKSVNLPDGTKIPDYIETLVEMEKSAIEGKVGAWANSKPELQHASVEEIKEVWEMPRWLDRLLFAAFGAGGLGAIQMLRARTWRRSPHASLRPH